MDHSFHFPGHRGVTGQIWRETLMKADPRLGYYFPCSHVSCHRTHTAQSAKLTLLGTLRRSKIVDIYDNMRDRHLVWCLSGNVPDDINSELLGWETPVTACLGALADNGCFQQTGAHCPETQSRHLGTVEPFHPAWSRSIYHDILLAWKINDEIIFRDLSTLQNSRSRQFRLKIGLSDIAYTLP